MVDTTWQRRLLAKITVGDDCWLWTSGLTGDGYAQIRKDGPKQAVHRVMYEWFVGPIPKGLELDHLCRTPRCVRPDHLEPVTHLENVRRGRGGWNTAVKTHCPQGHPYDEANTIKRDGRRHCRACKKRWRAVPRRLTPEGEGS